MNLWDRRFIELANLVGSWSKDPSTKCGAVIVDNQHRVISVGFNGFPSKFPDDPKLWNDRETKLNLVLHAEENAILFSKQDLSGCTIYTIPMPPCSRCASKIAQAGIIRVVAPRPNVEQARRWNDSFLLAQTIYKELDIELELI